MIEQAECRTLARKGPVYNPYRRETATAPSSPPEPQQARSQPVAAQPGTTIGYRPGTRGDVFPRSEGYSPQTFTGPTKGL